MPVQYVTPAIPGLSRIKAPLRTIGSSTDEYNPRRDLTLIAIAVLVFGTLAVGVLGFGATPVLDDEEGDGTVFPIQDWDEDGPEEIQLVIEANRTELQPGEAVEFTVSYENGTAAPGTTVNADGTEYDLDEDGQATILFERGGEFTVRADKDGSELTRYVSDATIVSVNRFEIDLSLSPSETDVQAGENVTFSLERADTGETVAGRLDVDGETYETNESGQARVPFERAGTFEVTASKSETDTERFVDGTATVAVDRRTVGLSVTQDPTAPTVGDEVLLEIRRDDTEELVNGTAVVDEEDRRFSGGQLSLTSDRATSKNVSVTVPETDSEQFESVSRTVAFDRHVTPLELTASTTTVERGEPVTFTGTRTDTNEPVPGTLTVGDRTHWLDWQGTASVTFDETGDVAVKLTRASTATHTFTSDELTVTVLDTNYELAVLDAPETVARGAGATVEAEIHNTGADHGTTEVIYEFDGGQQATETVAIGPGERETVGFAIPIDVPAGEYEHAVTTRDDSADGTITVEIAED